MVRFICVTGGKGGVGKTTAAVNLASSLSKMGCDCILVDANISTPNVHHHLGHDDFGRSIHDAIAGNVHIAEAIHKHSSGLKIVPSYTELQHLKFPDYDNLRDVLTDLEGHGELIVLDSAAGLGNEAVVPMEVSDEILIVTTPDHSAVEHAKKTVEVAGEIGKTVIGVILNNVRKDRLEHSVDDVEKELGLPILAIIPHDKKVRSSLKKKGPVVDIHPKSKSSREFLKLAELLLGKRYAKMLEKEEKTDYESYMKKRLNID